MSHVAPAKLRACLKHPGVDGDRLARWYLLAGLSGITHTTVLVAGAGAEHNSP